MMDHHKHEQLRLDATEDGGIASTDTNREEISRDETSRLAYWREALSDAPASLSLPIDRLRPERRSGRLERTDFSFVIERERTSGTPNESSDLSVDALLCAAWSILLSRLSGQRDVVFGLRCPGAAAARTPRRADAEVTLVPLRVVFDDAESAGALLARVASSIAQALAHYVPVGRIAEALHRASIFETSVAIGERGENSTFDRGGPPLELMLALDMSAAEIRASVYYASDSFQQSTIKRWIGFFKRLAVDLAKSLDRPIHSFSLMSTHERRQVVHTFNATSAPYPHTQAIHRVFEAQVVCTPERIAVLAEDRALTYAELNDAANTLAWRLIREGVKPHDYVAVLMSRSSRMLIAQLAVLKSGGAYVPIDPDLPLQRREFLIKDCGARYVLTEGVNVADAHLGQLTCIDAAMETAGPAPGNPNVGIGHPAAAYVMYTSGSTGAPKGVIVPHHAVNRLVLNNSYVRIDPDDCVAHYSNPAFDASTFEIWAPLLNGARVAIIPQQIVLSVERFAEALSRQSVTVLWMSVGLFNRYCVLLSGVFRRLRYLIVGGDSLEPESIRRVLRDCAPDHLLNGYGPTECTTFSSTHEIKRVDDGAVNIPIGRPIGNTRIYILDERQRPAAIGEPGEIYIGGDGVALGYLNRPELTAERFIPDPFDDARLMYRSGDRGRWRADGLIEFLGRTDQQIKIRGFRIEPGEIEARLVQHPAIEEAVVVVREDAPGEKRLVAYVVLATRNERPSVEELREYLKGALPEYMVPSAIVTLDQLPLTENGKVNRRALPAPGLSAHARARYEAPHGEIEQAIADIWRALLRVERVGREDNFFELGGHSLLVVEMVEQLRRRNLFVEAVRIYDHPTLAAVARITSKDAIERYEIPPNLILPSCTALTPEMLPLVALAASDLDRIVRSVPGGSGNIQDIYPLTSLQEGILFHHLFDEHRGDTYVLPTLLTVSPRQRVDEFVAAVRAVIERHDVLRTAVLWDQLPRPVQVVYRNAELPVEEVRLDSDRDALAQAREWTRPERQKLDLSRAPLARVRIAPDPNGARWFVLLQLHHLTIDHVTEEIVISEIVAHLEGRARLLPNAIPYRNHVAQALAHAARRDAESFFRSKLVGVTEPTAPFDLLEVRGDGAQIEEVRETVDADLANRIRAQARRSGVSPAILFHAAWALVVANTSGRDDVVFGSLFLGRMHGAAGAQRIMGLFINTLPLRLRLTDLSPEQLVQQTHRELVDLLEHEQASLAIAQRCSDIVGSAPLFSSLLNYRHGVQNPDAQWNSASGIRLVAAPEWTNYPITVSVDDLATGFAIVSQTDKRIDPRRVVTFLRTAMLSLLSSLEQAATIPVLRLPVLPPDERRQVVERFNPRYPGERSPRLIHERFEQQAQRAAESVALVHEGQELSYGELNARANRLARFLRGQGVQADDLVGLCLERGFDMVVALIAILKAGAAYVPLDPEYPLERLTHMLEDAKPRLVLTHERLRRRLAAPSSSQLFALEQLSSATAGLDDSDLAPLAGPTNLAYVIFTSGSTGRPKGVMVEHRNVTRLFEVTQQWFNFDARDVWTLFHSVAFDFSVWELWGGLLHGGRVVIVPQATARSAREFYRLICEQRVTVLNQTPSAFTQLIDAHVDAPGDRHSLRLVIFGGEALELHALRPWVARNGASTPRLINMYGITETTVHVTYREITQRDVEAERGSLIGRPLPDLQVYLLTRHGQPAPIGVTAEMYVGGNGVARGYLHRPELTGQRFLPDPFRQTPDGQACLYKTGDLARWRSDGTLEYLGRNDAQVKIRGFRIELGEIEARLCSFEEVRECAVVAREDAPGDKRLVAYLVPRQAGSLPSAAEIRGRLRSTLPEFMIPSAVVALERLPLTSNGKLDRQALPAPGMDAYGARSYEPPQGPIEQALADIWSELLHVERVGRDDDFFALGGHSLLATQALGRIRARLALELPMRTLFQFPTIKTLAQDISSQMSSDAADPGVHDMIEQIASLSDSRVKELLQELRSEGRA